MSKEIPVVTCIFEENGRVLMTLRSNKEPNYGGAWTFPAGRVKTTETLEQAVKREMMEELGIRVKRCQFRGVIEDVDPTSKKPYKHNVFTILKWIGEIKDSKEADRLGWFTLNEISKLHTFPVTFRLLRCAGYKI